MTALEALALADAANVQVSIARDFIRWRCRGAPPADVLAALKAAKPEIVTLLKPLSLDPSGALTGDALLARLAGLGFRVRRYGRQAALDDAAGQGRVPPAPLLYEFADRQREYGVVLVALGAADRETSP
jgi:hypothetical protein